MYNLNKERYNYSNRKEQALKRYTHYTICYVQMLKIKINTSVENKRLFQILIRDARMKPVIETFIKFSVLYYSVPNLPLSKLLPLTLQVLWLWKNCGNGA